MFRIKTLAIAAFGLTLAACTMPETPTRGLNDVAQLPAVDGMPIVQAQYDVQNIQIIVPRDLRVSEANVFFPIADIVWHGEPLGDRYKQVEAIYAEATQRATTGMDQGRAVNVSVQITRFHCLTPKTRYTVGGVHSLEFVLQVTDAKTGDIIDGPRLINADVKGSGGMRAQEEEDVGITQRIVIVNRLVQVFQDELTRPLPQVPGDSVISRDVFSPLALTAVE